MTETKPYWTMSRLDLGNYGRYDWLYKHPSPQPRIKTQSQIGKTAKSLKPLHKSKQSADPAEEIERIGFKLSEYKSIPRRPPLRGCTAPSESGRIDTFKDMHTPIQITKKFNGSPIISVPIASSLQTPTFPHRLLNNRRSTNNNELLPIHEVLFEESIDPHEEIDPWGYSRDEKVVVPDKNFHGIKLTVSHLHQKK